jgi:hypothetical protein
MKITEPLPYPVEFICDGCPWFKGDHETAEEGEHCRITKPSLKKKTGNCGANSECKGIV